MNLWLLLTVIDIYELLHKLSGWDVSFFQVASYPVIARLYNGCDYEAATPKNRVPPRRLDSIGKLMAMNFESYWTP